MEKELFEVLLEDIQGKVEAVIEAVQTTREVVMASLDEVKADVSVLKADVSALKVDVRDIKRGMGVLQSIANDHESRLQGLEGAFRDHLSTHRATR